MRRLAPGVDETAFRAGAGGEEIRARYGLGDRPVVVCFSRLVPRKGQDVLIRAWPRVRRAVPDAALLIVGGGPYRAALERARAELDLTRSVTITGAVPWEELPAHYDAGNVFAMPCRTRRRGLDVDLASLTYPGEYHYVPEYLASNGWETAGLTSAELLRAMGLGGRRRTRPGDAEFIPEYITATRV